MYVCQSCALSQILPSHIFPATRPCAYHPQSPPSLHLLARALGEGVEDLLADSQPPLTHPPHPTPPAEHWARAWSTF